VRQLQPRRARRRHQMVGDLTHAIAAVMGDDDLITIDPDEHLLVDQLMWDRVAHVAQRDHRRAGHHPPFVERGDVRVGRDGVEPPLLPRRGSVTVEAAEAPRPISVLGACSGRQDGGWGVSPAPEAARSMRVVHEQVVATVAWRELAATSVAITGACNTEPSDLRRNRHGFRPTGPRQLRQLAVVDGRECVIAQLSQREADAAGELAGHRQPGPLAADTLLDLVRGTPAARVTSRRNLGARGARDIHSRGADAGWSRFRDDGLRRGTGPNASCSIVSS
jgi:hypothetical protein